MIIRLGTVLALLAMSGMEIMAGPGFLVITRERNSEDTTSDDFVLRKWLKFDSDKDQTFYLFRPTSFGDSSVLDPAINDGPDPILDLDILQSLEDSVERWTEPDSDLGLNTPQFSEDGAVPGIPYLEFGPFELAMDTRNLVTFRDPNSALPAGVLFTPIHYYFQSDFEINLQENPERWAVLAVDIADQGLVIGGIATPQDPLGDGDGDGFSDLAFLLKVLEGEDTIPGGELIETDLLVNQGLDWNLYPQDQSDLSQDALEITDVLGTLDIGATLSKAVGRGIGLAESHLYESTLSPVYILDGDINDEFAVNPYKVRELSLDDESGVVSLYEGDEGGRIKGALLEGGGVPREVTAAPSTALTTIQDHPVYVGRQKPLNEPITLDTVIPQNTRWDIMEENLGPVELQAHTLSGPEIRFSDFTNRQGIDDGQFVIFPTVDGINGDYEIPGLPDDENWLGFTTPRDGNVSFLSAFLTLDTEDGPAIDVIDDFFRTLIDYPNEFFGGVDEDFPLPGTGDPDPSPPDDTTIRGEYIEFTPEYVPVVFTVLGNQFVELRPTGRFSVGLPESLALIEGRARSFSVELQGRIDALERRLEHMATAPGPGETSDDEA